MRVGPSFTPGRVMIALGVGHAGWAAVAYGGELRGITAAGLVDTVGDGIFRRDDLRGRRLDLASGLPSPRESGRVGD